MQFNNDTITGRQTHSWKFQVQFKRNVSAQRLCLPQGECLAEWGLALFCHGRPMIWTQFQKLLANLLAWVFDTASGHDMLKSSFWTHLRASIGLWDPEIAALFFCKFVGLEMMEVALDASFEMPRSCPNDHMALRPRGLQSHWVLALGASVRHTCQTCKCKPNSTAWMLQQAR